MRKQLKSVLIGSSLLCAAPALAQDATVSGEAPLSVTPKPPVAPRMSKALICSEFNVSRTFVPLAVTLFEI